MSSRSLARCPAFFSTSPPALFRNSRRVRNRGLLQVGKRLSTSEVCAVPQQLPNVILQCTQTVPEGYQLGSCYLRSSDLEVPTSSRNGGRKGNAGRVGRQEGDRSVDIVVPVLPLPVEQSRAVPQVLPPRLLMILR